MASIHIGIGHDYDLVIAQLLQVEGLAEAGTQCCDYRLQLIVVHNLLFLYFLYVEHLAPQRQDSLGAAVPALLGRAAGTVALDNVDLALLRILGGAVGKFFRKSEAVGEGLLAKCVLGLPGGYAGCGLAYRFLQNLLYDLGVELEVVVKLIFDQGIHNGAHLGVAQLFLGLSLELRLRNLHGKDCNNTCADILA